MNIFLSFLQSDQQHPIPAYDFWQYYIKNGITEAGYQWTECPDADWKHGHGASKQESFEMEAGCLGENR